MDMRLFMLPACFLVHSDDETVKGAAAFWENSIGRGAYTGCLFTFSTI